MGRSVSTPPEAIEVFYVDWIGDSEDPTDLQDDFDMLVEDLQNVLGELFPSVYPTEEWIGREDRVVAQNGLIAFGISEYSGLAAIWAVSRERHRYDPWDVSGLAIRWLDRAWPKLAEFYPGRLYRTGSMSNGESVYRRVAS